jgi:hypothetical protein
MLRESPRVRQIPGDYFRRWFTGNALALFIWYEADGSIHGFQLSYDLENDPRALTWTPTKGFSHASIDDGEESVLSNRTPLLRPSSGCDPLKLRADFISSADGLPSREKSFVEARLAEAARDRRVL